MLEPSELAPIWLGIAVTLGLLLWLALAVLKRRS